MVARTVLSSFTAVLETVLLDRGRQGKSAKELLPVLRGRSVNHDTGR